MVITISLIIVAGKDGTIELVVINEIGCTIFVLVVNIPSSIDAVSDKV